MPKRPFFSIVAFSLICLAGASLSGCVVANRPYGGYVYASPPPVMYSYHYYPNAEVYYDVSTGIYFYLSSGGGWIQTRVLPPGLRIRLGSYVPIRSQYKRPYRDFDKHRRTYPPRHNERERYQDRYDYRNKSYPRYQAPPPNWRDSDQRYDQRGYSPDDRDRRYQQDPVREDRDRRFQKEPANNNGYNRNEGGLIHRVLPQKHPLVKEAGKNKAKHSVKEKKQSKQKHSNKDKNHKDKGKKDQKDRKDRRDDRSDNADDRRNSDRNRDRDRFDR